MLYIIIIILVRRGFYYLYRSNNKRVHTIWQAHKSDTMKVNIFILQFFFKCFNNSWIPIFYLAQKHISITHRSNPIQLDFCRLSWIDFYTCNGLDSNLTIESNPIHAHPSIKGYDIFSVIIMNPSHAHSFIILFLI